jgi:hypothetical protein
METAEFIASHKISKELESSQLIYYAIQVFAGKNHYMVMGESNSEFICTIVREGLPSKDGTRALELPIYGHTCLFSNACKKFVATFNTKKQICEAGNETDL